MCCSSFFSSWDFKQQICSWYSSWDLHGILCTSLIFLSAGAVGSGVTGYVANKYFTEALSERNYSKVSFVHNSFWTFLIHVKATAGETLSRFSVGSQQSSSTCSVMRWKRFFDFCFLNLKVYPTGKPWSSARGLWSERRRQHLQHRKSPASHVWQVRLTTRLSPDWRAISRERGIENFRGSGIEKSTEESKESILRRIACIEAVHRIRCILVKECFIGTPTTPMVWSNKFVKHLLQDWLVCKTLGRQHCWTRCGVFTLIQNKWQYYFFLLFWTRWSSLLDK